MKKSITLLVSLFILGFSTLYGQDIQIKGTVTSAADGSKLPGVYVLIKGTNNGTVTDADGNYSIAVPSNATLVFSSIGMVSSEVAVNGQTIIDVVLAEDVTQVDEVVVTALGISREKKALGYSVQQVAGEEVNKVRETNFASSLSGKVAGLQVKQANTMGGSVNILVRGASSVTGNNQALFVIDGVPVDNSNTNTSDQRDGWGGYDYGNAASDINPDDIESLSILKGAAATALYGSRAANGVILVTTKKGKSQKGLGVSVNSGVMFSMIDKSTAPKWQKEYGAGYGAYLDEDDLNGDGEVELIAPVYDDASWGVKFDPDLMVVQWDALDPTYSNFAQATPWVAPKDDYLSFFRTGVKFTNNIAIDGGNETGTFRLSYTNIDEDGILPNSSSKKNTLNFSGTYKLSPKFSAEANVSYINTRTIGRYGTGYNGKNVMQGFGQWFETNVDFEKLKDYQTPDGRQRTWNYVNYDDLRAYYSDNPYWTRHKNYSNDGRDRVLGYVKLNYDLTKWLKVTGRVSDDYYHEFQEERVAINSAVAGDLPYYNKFHRAFNELNTELFLNFDKSFNKIQLTGLLGVASRANNLYSTYGTTTGGLGIADFYSLKNSKGPVRMTENDEESRVNSVFGSLNIGYNRIVYLDLTTRVDKSSTLPEDKNTYVYPSVSTSFILSELDAIKNIGAISLLKLRLNYAEVGNDAPVYSTRPVYTQNDNWRNTLLFSMASTMLNPELKSERSKSWEGGLETSFLNNRISFDLSLYKTKTFDQIMPVQVSTTSGISFVYINGGEIDNKGIELGLTAVPVKLSNFEWNVNFNWYKHENEVVRLYEGIDNYLLFSQWDVSVNARVGKPYGNIEGSNWVYTNGQRTVGEDGYYLRSDKDETLGNINPDWNMGVTNTFKYKNLSAKVLIDIQKGGDIYSVGTKYGRSTGLYEETAGLNELGVEKRTPVADNPNGGVLFDAVFEDGTKNNIRVDAYEWGQAYDYNMLPTAAYVFDASYVKLREVALTYDLPVSIIGKTPFKQVSLSAVGRNLWIIHKNTKHFDPEAALSSGNQQGIESGAYPTTRNIGFDISLKF